MMPKVTDSLPQGPPASAPLFGNFKMMSLNCNGLLTAVQRDNKRVPRYKVIRKCIAAKQSDIVGL